MTILNRLRSAERGSRELDFRIHIAAVNDAIWPVHDRLGRVTNPDYRMSDYLRDYDEVINSDDQDFDFPRYTESIDAALVLVERTLPCGLWRVERCRPIDAKYPYWASAGLDGEQEDTWATTAPLAILTALFSALEAKEAKHD